MDLLTKMEGSERTVTITVDLGEANGNRLDGLRNALTARGVKPEIVDDVIATHAVANLKVYFRSIAKAGMKGPKDGSPLTDEQIQEKIDKAVPGVAPEREAASTEKKLASAAKAFENMTPEEQLAYLEALKAKLKAAQ